MRTLEQTFTGVLPFSMAGKMLRIITASNPVTVRMYSGSGISEAVSVADGYWCKPAGGFDRIEFIAGSSTYIKAVLSDGESGLDVVTITNTLQVVVANPTATPALVDEVKSGVVTDNAAVTVGTAATSLVAARATRRCVRVLNSGTDYIYIGSASVTTTNGAVRVGPGQMWEECEAAAAALYAISSTAGQNVRVQEVG